MGAVLRSERAEQRGLQLQPHNLKNNVKTNVYVNAPAGLIYPGDAGFPPGRTGLNKQWLNFSPRVGMAWDVTGDGRTAIRGSYGLTYDLPNGEYS